MSNVVDERIVEMRFDNAQFEKNVQTSMSTLEKLKKSLKFSNSSKDQNVYRIVGIHLGNDLGLLF